MGDGRSACDRNARRDLGFVVESLDGAEAREHIEMIERILAESSQRLRSGADYFIVWGLYSAVVTASWQLIRNGTLPLAAAWGQAALLLVAIAYSVARARSKETCEGRRSLVQREFLNMLYLTLGLAFIMNVGAYRLLPGWSSSVIWSFAEAVVLLFVGLHGNRRALVGGIVVVVSVVVANFTPPSQAGFALAAGMLLGYGGFGVADLLARE
jgi:hypothetical protein